MKDPLVSIITPCFNGEKFLYRCLDAILNQTYSNIEFIFVNDGSTDTTEEIILSYKKNFADKGIAFKYIDQKNKGLGGAILAGLKIFTGEYLCWPDSDDMLMPNSIEKRVRFLEHHLEFGSVSSNAYIFNQDDLINPIGFIANKEHKNLDQKQFLHLLLGKSIFCSGCHMVRAKAFLDVNPNRYIYPAKRGQNWQMLLPLYYKYDRGFIDEPLYAYINYRSSMSKDHNKEEILYRISEHDEIIYHTLKQINMPEHEFIFYNNLIKNQNIKRRFDIASSFQDKKLLEEQYELLKQNKIVSLKDKTVYWLSKFHVYNTARYLKRLLKGLWK